MFIFKVVAIFSIYLLFIFKETYCESEESITGGLKGIFQAIGFSPSCISSSMASCEQKKAISPLLVNTEKEMMKIASELGRIKEPMMTYPKNCADLLEVGDTQSGIRKIYPYCSCNMKPIKVFCDQETDGGGWTVIQYRNDNQEREDFYRTWTEYKLGFGNLKKEFWIGLDNIHALVSDTLMELRVDLGDYEGSTRWAKYDFFYISNELEKYRLEFGKYSGNAGDGLISHLGSKFTTHDQDNDADDNSNCAKKYKGGWWYQKCHISNLNGLPHQGNHSSFADGIIWKPFRGYHYSLKETKLAIRPRYT